MRGWLLLSVHRGIPLPSQDFYREALPERDSYVGVGYALSLLCALLTPTANPFYYTIFNSSFKAAVYDMCPCFYKERSHSGISDGSCGTLLPVNLRVERVEEEATNTPVRNVLSISACIFTQKERFSFCSFFTV